MNGTYFGKLDEEISKLDQEITNYRKLIKENELALKRKGKYLDKYENEDGMDKILKER